MDALQAGWRSKLNPGKGFTGKVAIKPLETASQSLWWVVSNLLFPLGVLNNDEVTGT